MFSDLPLLCFIELEESPMLPCLYYLFASLK